MLNVNETAKKNKEYFEQEQKKGKIPINIDFDKWMDEKEDFELGGDPEARLKKQRRLMEDNILSGALQKIDMAMSGIMSTLNLAGGGTSQFKNHLREYKVQTGLFFDGDGTTENLIDKIMIQEFGKNISIIYLIQHMNF